MVLAVATADCGDGADNDDGADDDNDVDDGGGPPLVVLY